MKQKHALLAIIVIALSIASCGGNGQAPCTNCEKDTLSVKDTLAPVEPTPGIDTPLAPVDSAMGPNQKVSL
jgi:PBP1b-binding outer membrane lipoprotein LpoB